MSASIKSVSDLKGWFVQSDKALWALYASSKPTEKSLPITVNNVNEDLTSSWIELEQTLQRLKNEGVFTLFVKGNAKASFSHSVVIELNPYSPHYGMSQMPPQMAGIGSPYGYSYGVQPFVGQLPPQQDIQQIKAELQERFEEKLAMQKQLLDNDFKIKEMMLKFNSQKTATDKFIGAIAEKPDKFFGFLTGLFSGGRPQAQLGLLEAESDMVPTAPETTNEMAQAAAAPPPPKKNLDFNKVTQGAIALFQLGITDIDDIIFKMAQTAQEDPEGAKAKFNLMRNYL